MSYLLHFSALVRTEIEKKHIPKCTHFRSTFRKGGLYLKKVTHTVLRYANKSVDILGQGKGEKLSDTVICPFVRMVQKKCSVVDAEILHLMLWKIYMVSARKEAFVADAKKELHPLFDQER